MRPLVLLNPGPCNVTGRVRAALSGPDLCHREPEYYDLQDRIRGRLLDVFGLDRARWAAVLLTGSGTAAVEAAVASCVSPTGRLLILDNGVYGDRMARMAEAHRIGYDRLRWAWNEPVDLEATAEALSSGVYEAVACVHHETTTGLINPVAQIGELAAASGVRLIADSVSGLAGDTFDFEVAQPAVAVSTANKCIQGLPGIAFCLARHDALAEMEGFPPRSLYLNLPGYYRHQEQRSTPFTPAVQIAYALDEALAELAEETVAGRIERYRRASTTLREGFERMGLELLLPPPLRSNTITALRLPRGVRYETLHDRLKDDGFVIYAGQGGLSGEVFRVANMGAIAESDLVRFLDCLAAAIRTS